MKKTPLLGIGTALLLLLTVCGTKQSAAQNEGTTTRIIGDTRVSLLVEKHIELNEQNRTLPGFRIQVASLSGNDSKRRAFEMQEKIREGYPDVEVYVDFDEPSFKVKVGDFLTRLEAYAFLQRIKLAYPGTIVKDNVNVLPPPTEIFDFDPNDGF